MELQKYAEDLIAEFRKLANVRDECNVKNILSI